MKVDELQAQVTIVQTVILSKERFSSVEEAEKWITSHEFKNKGVDETEDSYRFRQRDPGDFVYSSFRTINITDGVKAVIGHLKSKNNAMIDEIESKNTYDIEDVEIFSEGVWNGDKYTEKDLDDMVAAFVETKDLLKPHLKIGHSAEQNLRKIITDKGAKLIANFERVPKKIAELIKQGGFRRVSCEIFWNLEIAGKKFRRALKAVSLLGGELPAVTNLDDIISLYASHGVAGIYSEDTESHEYEIDKEDVKMTIEELQKQLAEMVRQVNLKDDELKKLTSRIQEYENEKKKDEDDGDSMPMMKKKIAELEEENAKLKKKIEDMVKKNTEMESQLNEYGTKSRHVEINAKLDKLIHDGKLMPAKKSVAFILLDQVQSEKDTKKYSIDGKELTMEEILYSFLEQQGINTEVGTEFGKVNDLDERIKGYMEKNKV